MIHVYCVLPLSLKKFFVLQDVLSKIYIKGKKKAVLFRKVVKNGACFLFLTKYLLCGSFSVKQSQISIRNKGRFRESKLHISIVSHFFLA